MLFIKFFHYKFKNYNSRPIFFTKSTHKEPVGMFKILHAQAVGWDSGIPFILSNFVEGILQQTSLKMSPTSNSGL